MVVGVRLSFFFSIVILDTSDKSKYDICLSFHHSTCQIRGFVITMYQFSLKQLYSLFFFKVAPKNATHAYMHVSTGVQSLQAEKVATFSESPARSCPCGSPDSGQFEQGAGLSAIVINLHPSALQRRRNIFPQEGFVVRDETEGAGGGTGDSAEYQQ